MVFLNIYGSYLHLSYQMLIFKKAWQVEEGSVGLLSGQGHLGGSSTGIGVGRHAAKEEGLFLRAVVAWGAAGDSTQDCFLSRFKMKYQDNPRWEMTKSVICKTSQGPERSKNLMQRKADQPKQLIAADFGHAHTFGRAYYVATRFFDRALKKVGVS